MEGNIILINAVLDVLCNDPNNELGANNCESYEIFVITHRQKTTFAGHKYLHFFAV